MMIWTARLSKKRAILGVLLLGVIIAAVIILVGNAQKAEEVPELQLATNDDRVAYLESMGWEINPEPVETLQFLFPETLEEPYLSYNELQDSQGFDLSRCCGKQVARYTYTVTNYPGKSDGIQANLYICEEQPVAGDILCPGENGFQTTLVYPEAS